MPPAARYHPDHRPKWATALYDEIQRMIGQQLRVQYPALQDLPPNMVALLKRMDEPHDLKA
jgi:hypothetical protein